MLYTNCWRRRQNADQSGDYDNANDAMTMRLADPPRSAFCRVPACGGACFRSATPLHIAQMRRAVCQQ